MGLQNKSFSDLITFTRASGGTSFRPVWYGPELVSNGTFDSGVAGWSGSLNANAIDGVGAMHVYSTWSGVGARVVKHAMTGLIPGETYSVSASVGSFGGTGALSVNPSIQIKDIADVVSVAIIVAPAQTNTTISGTFVATESSHLVCARWNGNASTNTSSYLSFDNISVKQIILDRAGDPIELFTSPTNVPRIDYDPVTGSCRGLLIEEQRVNYRHTSDIFSTFVKRNNIPVITDNVAIAPNGQQVAALISGAGTVIWDGASSVQVGISGLPADSTCTLSMYFKSAGATTVSINCRNQNTGAIGTGTLALDDTWKRISATQQIGANGQVGITIGQADGDFLVAHCQLELGSFPTSYIPTTGASATRAADVASINTLSPWYNAAEGTWYAEFIRSFSNTDGAMNGRLIGSDANVNTILGVRNINTAESWNNVTAIASANVFTVGANAKAGAAYSSVGRAVVLNAGAVASDAGLMQVVSSSVSIGGPGSGVTNRLNGHIRAIRYTPKRLSDAQLQAMTT